MRRNKSGNLFRRNRVEMNKTCQERGEEIKRIESRERKLGRMEGWMEGRKDGRMDGRKGSKKKGVKNKGK